MTGKLLMAAGAALLAGTTVAAAQAWDDPPGWAFQRRGILESEGVRPDRPGAYVGPYGAYGYYRGDPYRYRGDAPGERFQDRGIRDERGEAPGWRW